MSHRELHEDATSLLIGWSPPTPSQAALREAYLGFLAARTDATARACAPGHLTASAVVLSAELDRTLLTLHPRVGRWLQLGGHCEDGDRTLRGAALREAIEESGIDDLRVIGGPLQLDVHPITCSLGLPTRHFDVRFAVVSPPGARAVMSDESDDLAWWPVDALPDGVDPLLARSVDLARECADNW